MLGLVIQKKERSRNGELKHGFAFPPDNSRHQEFRIEGSTTESTNALIRFIFTEDDSEIMLVLPFDDTEVFCDSDGNYCGIHPRGAYIVNRAEVDEIVEQYLAFG